MKPASYCISVFGGVRKLARAIGRDPSTVSKWKKPKSQGGCNGRVPSMAAEAILKFAIAYGLDITPSDILNGRSVEKK